LRDRRPVGVIAGPAADHESQHLLAAVRPHQDLDRLAEVERRAGIGRFLDRETPPEHRADVLVPFGERAGAAIIVGPHGAALALSASAMSLAMALAVRSERSRSTSTTAIGFRSASKTTPASMLRPVCTGSLTPRP